MIEVDYINEIPLNSNLKYEIKDGRVFVDRVLKDKIPFNYGFMPNTLWDDGDPLDVVLFSNHEIISNSKLIVKAFGVLKMQDNGFNDNKLLACISKTDIGFCLAKAYDWFTTYKYGINLEGFDLQLKDVSNTILKAKELYEKA